MKLSTKLLLAILTLAVFALVGTNMAMKGEYDRIDFKNPFWNYERVPLASFRHLNLRSGPSFLVEIRQGSDARPVLYVSKSWKDSLQVEQGPDTLQIRFHANRWTSYREWENDEPQVKPALILLVPDLQTLTVQHQSWLRLKGIRYDSLDLRASAFATVSITDSQFDFLRLALRDSAFVTIPRSNRLGTLSVDASGKTALKLGAQSVGRFQPVIRDERVELRLSGKALTGVMPQALPGTVPARSR